MNKILPYLKAVTAVIATAVVVLTDINKALDVLIVGASVWAVPNLPAKQ